MAILPFGFCGPGYTSQAKEVAGERSINVYPELIPPGVVGKSGIFLNKVPGRKKFATLPEGPVRALWAGDNRLFAVGGSKFYEVQPNGTAQQIGICGLAQTPATIVSNGNALMVVSGAQAFVTNGALPGGSQLQPVTQGVLGAYLDGYLIAQAPDSNKFLLSGLLDQNAWDPLDFGLKIGGPDRLAAIFVDHEELWLLGFRTTEVWYNSGAANFPFQKITGAFLEDGITAPFSVQKVDNSMMFVEGNDRGAGVVVRMQGYTPVRVSNHAIEFIMQRWGSLTDIVGTSKQYLGHSLYEIHSPTGDSCLVYDVATGMWFEKLRWDTSKAMWHEDPCRFHAYGNFPGTVSGASSGQHFVGDARNGNIYVESADYLDNDGEAIRWLRSSPHICDHLNWTYHENLIFDMQCGGATGFPGGNPAIQSPFLSAGGNPQVMLRVSDDGGNTWGSERWASAGRLGQYEGNRFRVKFNQLGRSLDRCYELSGTDSIQIAIVDAALKAYPEGQAK